MFALLLLIAVRLVYSSNDETARAQTDNEPFYWALLICRLGRGMREVAVSDKLR